MLILPNPDLQIGRMLADKNTEIPKHPGDLTGK
jgi:hypothetical protein